MIAWPHAPEPIEIHSPRSYKYLFKLQKKKVNNCFGHGKIYEIRFDDSWHLDINTNIDNDLHCHYEGWDVEIALCGVTWSATKYNVMNGVTYQWYKLLWFYIHRDSLIIRIVECSLFSIYNQMWLSIYQFIVKSLV